MSYELAGGTAATEDLWATEEVGRLFHLPDRFLGRAIIVTMRSARLSRPDRFAPNSVPSELKYAAALVWDIGPEIARRLGETDLNQGEAGQRARYVSATELRLWAWTCLRKTAVTYVATSSQRGHKDWRLILNDPSEGNPLFVALDRLHPPESDHDDVCARYIAAMDRNRGAEHVRLTWSPEPQGTRIRLSATEMLSVPLAPK
jgi:hypothetical protein